MQKIVKSTIVLAIFLTLNLISAPISLNQAQDVAKNWMMQKRGKEFNIDLNHLQNASKTSDSKKAYWIIRLKPKGWVIVAADDRATPIIGYGDSDIDDKIDGSFRAWMHGIEEEIRDGILKTDMKSLEVASSETISKKIINKKEQKIKSMWAKYKVDSKLFKYRAKKKSKNKKISRYQSNNYVVKPLLWLDGDSKHLNWNQNGYYADKTPIIDSRHTYVGCVAVAMAQIMRYHKYPKIGVGNHSYYLYSASKEISANFNHEYKWNNMPTYLTSQNSDVSQLLYDVGISVDMNYGLEGSGAYTVRVAYALLNYFKYKEATHRYRSNFDDNIWHEIIKSELDSKRPVFYRGGPASGASGHAFVIDGYDSDNFYHLNWGWGGASNGMFTIDDLTPYGGDYSNFQAMVNIKSKSDSEIINIYDTALNSCVMGALGITDKRDITKNQVESLTHLECKDMGIVDISALKYFTNMSDLHLDKNKISDLTALKDLSSLTILSIYSNDIESIESLKNLTSLNHLDIWNNKITDIDPLRGIYSLTYLDIGKNYIRDFSPIDHISEDIVEHKYDQHPTSTIITIPDNNLLSCVMDALELKNKDQVIKVKVAKLTSLNCQYRDITDLSGLEHFDSLVDLDLNNNKISDLTTLSSVDSLSHLRLYSNSIKDLSPIRNLTNLSYLDIWNNKIVDISALSNMRKLQYLDIGQNYIRDFSPISHLSDDVVDHKYDQHNLNAPSNLTFSNITKTSVTINWRDNSNNEDGFKIFRDGNLIKTVGQNSKSYTDSNLKSATNYRYTVKATKSD